MKKTHLNLKIFIFSVVKLRYLVFYFFSIVLFFTSLIQPVIANSFSGKQLKKMIIEELSSKGVKSDPAINDKRIFTGCAKEHLEITKRDSSWNTLKLACKNNKYWNFNFRNKKFTKNSDQRGVISHKNQHTFGKKIETNSVSDKNLVFVLTNSKTKDEIFYS